MSLLRKRISIVLAALAVLSLTASGVQGDAPREAIRQATLAVHGDSTQAVRRRMESRLRRDSTDRDAALALATIARLTFDHADAERRYRRLFEPDSLRPDPHAVLARMGLALDLESQGESGPKVLDLYRRALADARALGDRVAEGELLFRIGSLLAPLGLGGPGPAYLDSATRVLPENADDVLANVRCRRAQVLIATAGPSAGDSLRVAWEFARQAGDPDAEAFCLRAEGVRLRIRGETDSAAVAQEALIALRRRTRDRSGLSVALVIRADLMRAQGDFGGSMRLFREAMAEARASGNHYIEATVSLGLGGNALALNDHATARELVNRAITAFEATQDSASLMLARSYLPFVSMAAGDLDLARQQTQAVLGFWRHHGDWLHLSDLWRQLAVIEMRAGRHDAAARALDESEAAARKVGSPGSVGAVEYDRGRLALRMRDFAAAERGFRAFLASVAPDEHLLRYDGRLRLAEVFARRGELARAELEMSAAGDALDRWREGLSDPELRSLAFQASGFEANDRNTSVAAVLSALVAGGRHDAALTLAERRRARELAERMARVAALSDQPEVVSPDSVVSRPPGLDDGKTVAESLPDESIAILEFVTGSGGAATSLLAVTRTSGVTTVRGFVLPAADSLVSDIGRVLALIERGDDPRALERRLGAALLDSVVSTLPSHVTRLVLVPDGPLHRVPWDALRLADGAYVAERFSTSVAPSIAVLAALTSSGTRDSTSGTARILALGNPTPEASDPDTLMRGVFDGAGGLPRLPYAEREARLVARYGSDPVVRLGEDASASFLERSSLRDFDIVHVAAHAIVDDRATTRTALALAPADGESGFVTPEELASLDLDAALVVLSACRSAGGVVVDGEGMQGLTAPLLQAGARSIVASSWRIDDRATVRLIEAFYAAMAGGANVADALREARLDAIRRGAPPREWAAFSAIGDPLVRLTLETPRRTLPWSWIAGGVLLLIVAGALAFRIISARAR